MVLSIILTVFNKEQYLQHVFEALLAQRKGEYELVVVNDGSSDNSLSIIEQYAAVNPLVRVFSQQNQGLSMARNNGVKVAIGDYVWFVDADDEVSPESVRLICEAAKSEPDMIPIYAKTDGIDKIRNKVAPTAKTGMDVLMGNKWEQCGVFYIFKKSFLKDNNLHFMPGVYHEDAEFTPRALYYAKSVQVVPEILYTVYRDPNSITQIPRPKRAFDYLTVAESLSAFVTRIGECGTRAGQVIAENVSQDINNAFFVICQNSTDDQHELNEIFYQKRKPLLLILSMAIQKKYHIEAFLFRLFPRRCVEVYKMMQKFNIKK